MKCFISSIKWDKKLSKMIFLLDICQIFEISFVRFNIRFVFCQIFDSFLLDYCHILKMAGPTFNKSTPISYFGGPFPPPLHSLCIASCASQKVPGHKQCQGSTKHCFFSPYGMEGGGVQEVRKFTPTNRNGMWHKQNWLSLSRHYHRCGYYT